MTRKIMQRYLANKSIETLQENIKNIQIDQKKAGREQQKNKDEANGKQRLAYLSLLDLQTY